MPIKLIIKISHKACWDQAVSFFKLLSVVETVAFWAVHWPGRCHIKAALTSFWRRRMTTDPEWIQNQHHLSGTTHLAQMDKCFVLRLERKPSCKFTGVNWNSKSTWACQNQIREIRSKDISDLLPKKGCNSLTWDPIKWQTPNFEIEGHHSSLSPDTWCVTKDCGLLFLELWLTSVPHC